MICYVKLLINCFCIRVFQAKFKLTLEVPSDLVALSNMPVAKETVSGPIKTVFYEESPLMSTYLVAIVVGLFDYIESSTSEGRRLVFIIHFFFENFFQIAVLMLFFPYLLFI